MSATHIELKSGSGDVDCIYEELKGAGFISTLLMFDNSGQLYVKNPHIPRLSAMLLMEGTKALGPTKFAALTDELAIELSAYDTTSSFALSISSLKEHYPRAIELLQMLLKDPNYTNETLLKIKAIYKAGLQAAQSRYASISRNAFMKLLYPNTHYANIPTDMIERVDEVSLEDIKQYLKETFSINNLVVIAGGDIDTSDLQKELTPVMALFGETKSKKISPYEPIKAPKSVTIYKNTQQAAITFGAPLEGPLKAEDAAKSRVANYLLGGGGFGSRLMDELRVKHGLTYGISSSFVYGKRAYLFVGQIETKVASQDEAIERIKEVVKLFVQKGITQKELDEAKRFLCGSEPLRQERIASRLQQAYSGYKDFKDPNFYKNINSQIEALSLDEVNRYIKTLPLANTLSFAIVTSKDKPKQ